MSQAGGTLAGRTVRAYERAGRPPAIRDRVLVLPSVICSHVVAERIAERVPGAVATPHDHGCAQLGDDKAATRRTMVGVAQNPNVAGTLVVGLGCESIQSDSVVAGVREAGLPVESVVIQEAGGTDQCIEMGERHARQLAEGISGAGRSPVGAESLTVGIVTTDLQESTLKHADPLVGAFVDRIVESGGRVVVAGRERFLADARTIEERLETQTAHAGFAAMRDRHEPRDARSRRLHRRSQELSADALLEVLGEARISDVLAYGERGAHDRGVAIVDAPHRFAEAATALAAAGAHLVVHVTGDGIPTGHPIVPVLKLTGDNATASALPEDIDLNARTTAVDELVERVLSVASGGPTRAERHGLADFAITRFGPSM